MTQARRPLVAGNWKMNGLHHDGLALATALAARIAERGAPACDLVLCPPATLLREVAAAVAAGPIAVGGQDCHAEEKGAHTGDISAPMLRDAGCRFVIVGHSERRADHGEGDGEVQAKAAAAHHAGLTAIICVGELETERAAGHALEVVRRQLEGSVPPGSEPTNTVIAYEPVWAIGTGQTATSADIEEVHHAVRASLAQLVPDGAALRVLYGGSVKPDNAAGILSLEDVDGALVGGASLKADDFWAIVESCP